MYEMICSVAIWLLRPLSIPLNMLLHAQVGERFLGFSGVLALIVLIALATTCPGDESGPLWIFMVAFIVRVAIYQFACSHRREHGGPQRHSRYPGRPLFGLLSGRMKEDTIIGLEIVLVFAIGAAIRMANQPLGDYLLCAAGAMVGVMGLRESVNYDRVLDRLDAEIEQEAEDAEVRKRKGGYEPKGGGIYLCVDEEARMARRPAHEMALIESGILDPQPDETSSLQVRGFARPSGEAASSPASSQ